MDGNGDGLDDFAKFVERIGHALSSGGDAASFVVADVMDDVVAAEVFELFGAVDHVGAAEVVAHDFDSVVLSGPHDAFDRFLVCACHDDDVSGAGFGHHFGFEIAAVHCF